ncbi:MAG: hypothetical protein LIO87_02355, partial [Eubacterium sp.]|nr:hypothetical protein [Eubacterium sp.]
MYDLKTDKEFRSLVFPADQKYYDNLEEDIFNCGCKNPIIVWENIIIDGCKRYEICKNWELPFTIKYMNFNNRFEAVSWICQNQLQRDDITEEMHRYLIGKYFEAEKSAYLSTVDSINSERKSSGFQYHIAKRLGTAFSLVAST